MSKTSYLFVVITTLLLGGCKLSVENSGGGIITSDDGKINCGEICEADYSNSSESVTLTATPDVGYQFDGWGGACSGTDSCIMNIDSKDGTVSAQFSIKPTPFTITIDTQTSDLKIAQGLTGQLTTTINVIGTATDSSTIKISQELETVWGNAVELEVTPFLSESFITDQNVTKNYQQNITSDHRGLHKITTTAEVVETGKTTTEEVMIYIGKAGNETPIIYQPTATPDALRADTITPVIFTASIKKNNTDEAITVSLSGDIRGQLNDDAHSGDLIEDDGVFGGTFDIDSSGMTPGDCLSFTARVQQGSYNAQSTVQLICLSSFPVALQNPDITNTFTKPDGEQVIADEVLVTVAPNTSESQIKELVLNLDGSVIGTLPELNIYQIKLNSPPSTSTQWNTLLNSIKEIDFVDDVTENGLIFLNAIPEPKERLVPNDDDFKFQWYLDKIRAPEAWALAKKKVKGKALIAIVDSGADFSHPDLATKLIPGDDYIDGGIPQDIVNHGTLVAGIAAASTNNNLLVSGVSWGSKLLIQRVVEGKTGAVTNVTQGITSSVKKGAKIINVSMSTSNSKAKSQLCKAVQYATNAGRLVVAAVGNNSSIKENYPAACPGAVAVGGTNYSDQRHSISNYGSWVTLAAPSDGITATSLGGDAGTDDGTSFAAPIISGAIAVLLDYDSDLSITDAVRRLKDTAVNLPSQDLGAGRIDLYAAMFPPSELISDTVFEDENFKACVLEDAGIRDWVYVDEVFRLDHCGGKGINSLKGIDALVNLAAFYAGNNNLTSVNLSNNPRLGSVDLTSNKLKTLNINNTKIKNLTVNFNELESIDLSGQTNLAYLSLIGNNLSHIDLSDSSLVNQVHLTYNNLSSLDFKRNTGLFTVNAGNNKLDSINISEIAILRNLTLKNNNLSNLDVSNNHELRNLDISENKLINIDLSQNSKLASLSAYYNNLSSIDFSNNPKLGSADLRGNNLTNIDLTTNTEMVGLYAGHNKLSSINLSNNTNLSNLNLSHNDLSNIDLSLNVNLDKVTLDHNSLDSIDVTSNIVLEYLSIRSNPLTIPTMNYLASIKGLNGLRASYCSTLSFDPEDLVGGDGKILLCN